MRKLKQIFAMIFTMVFIVGASVSAYAAGEGSITIKNDPSKGTSIKGHTYSVYKVFDLSTFDSTNNKYAYSIAENFKNFFESKNTENKDLNQFAIDYITEDNKDDAAKELMKYAIDNNISSEGIIDANQNLSTDADGKETVSITGLDLGYYIVVDNGVNGEGKSIIAATAMGTTDKELVINLKASAPTIDKEIKHNEDGSWGNVGDNQIGDKVEYRFISTIPDVTGYDKYTYIIHDKMTEGLDFNNDVEIYVGEKSENKQVLDKAYYTVTKNPTDGDTFDISIDVIKGIKEGKFAKEDKLYIYFSATLNENALVAGDSNDNTVNLEYSNNPYDEDSKDKTPDVTVKDYTFKLNALKTIEDGKTPLQGAEFEIRDGGEDDPALYFKTRMDRGTNIYTVCPEDHTHESERTECTTKIVSGKNGKFEIVGLDDATKYTLVETKAPDGYNPIKPIDFMINATYENGSIKEVTVTKHDGSAIEGFNVDSFQLGTTIVNTSDTLLPETGGIGTTIFKVLGSSMMIFAAAVLIRKRFVG